MDQICQVDKTIIDYLYDVTLCFVYLMYLLMYQTENDLQPHWTQFIYPIRLLPTCYRPDYKSNQSEFNMVSFSDHVTVMHFFISNC